MLSSGCSSGARTAGLPLVLRFGEIHIEAGPQRDLQLEGTAPRTMHPVDDLRWVPRACEIGLDGFVQHCDKCCDVSEGDVRGGLDTICLILLKARVPESDLLLIIQPVLVVRTQAGIQNPLLKAQITLRKILREGL